jgi:hypothetical protein
MKQKSLPRNIGLGFVLAAWLLTGCTRAPSFDIWGSLFPAWLVCLIFGILLTTLGRWWLSRQQIPILFPILIYPSLTALITFVLWFIFFS